MAQALVSASCLSSREFPYPNSGGRYGVDMPKQTRAHVLLELCQYPRGDTKEAPAKHTSKLRHESQPAHMETTSHEPGYTQPGTSPEPLTRPNGSRLQLSFTFVSTSAGIVSEQFRVYTIQGMRTTRH